MGRALSSGGGLAGDAQGLLGLREPAGGRRVLTLRDALQRAVGDAPEARIAVEKTVQQDAQLRRAWAFLLPTLTASAAYNHNCTAGGESGINCADRTTSLVNQDQIDQQALLFESLAEIVGVAADAAGNAEDREAFAQQQVELQKAADDIRATDTKAIVTQPASQLGGQLTLTLPLLNPRAYPALMNAYDGVDAAGLVLAQSRQQLAFSVVRAYHAAVTAERLVKASERQVEATTTQRNAVQARVEASTQPGLSLKRAELELLRAQQTLAQSRAAADNAVALLGTTLGVDEMFALEAPPAVTPLAGDVEPVDAGALVDRALSQRVEVKSQRIFVRIAERGTVDAWMQFLPTVGLSASARATSFTQGFVRDPITGTLTLSASLPLYDGGLRYAAMHDSSSRTTEEQVRLHQLEERVAAQVRGNLRDVAVRQEALALSQRSLEVSKEAAGQAQALFDAGLGTALDLSETRFAVFVAETDTLRAELELATARLGLRWAVGDSLY